MCRTRMRFNALRTPGCYVLLPSTILLRLENALRALGNNTWGDNATLFSVPLGEALLARMHGGEAKTRAAFMRAREEQEKMVQADPNFAPPICILGLIDANLGRKKEALEETKRALELLPVSKDMSNGTDMLHYSAIAAAWAGEKDLACERLAAAVSTQRPQLRPTEAVTLVGPAPRRSALRKNRRLPRAERMM